MSSRDKSKHDRKTRDRSDRESPTYSYSADGSSGSAPGGSSYPGHNHPTTNIIQRDLDDMHVSDQIKFYEGRSLDAVEHCRKTGSLLILVIGDDSKANITLTEFDEMTSPRSRTELSSLRGTEASTSSVPSRSGYDMASKHDLLHQLARANALLREELSQKRSKQRQSSSSSLSSKAYYSQSPPPASSSSTSEATRRRAKGAKAFAEQISIIRNSKALAKAIAEASPPPILLALDVNSFDGVSFTNVFSLSTYPAIVMVAPTLRGPPLSVLQGVQPAETILTEFFRSQQKLISLKVLFAVGSSPTSPLPSPTRRGGYVGRREMGQSSTSTSTSTLRSSRPITRDDEGGADEEARRDRSERHRRRGSIGTDQDVESLRSVILPSGVSKPYGVTKEIRSGKNHSTAGSISGFIASREDQGHRVPGSLERREKMYGPRRSPPRDVKMRDEYTDSYSDASRTASGTATEEESDNERECALSANCEAGLKNETSMPEVVREDAYNRLQSVRISHSDCSESEVETGALVAPATGSAVQSHNEAVTHRTHPTKSYETDYKDGKHEQNERHDDNDLIYHALRQSHKHDERPLYRLHSGMPDDGAKTRKSEESGKSDKRGKTSSPAPVVGKNFEDYSWDRQDRLSKDRRSYRMQDAQSDKSETETEGEYTRDQPRLRRRGSVESNVLDADLDPQARSRVVPGTEEPTPKEHNIGVVVKNQQPRKTSKPKGEMSMGREYSEAMGHTGRGDRSGPTKDELGRKGEKGRITIRPARRLSFSNLNATLQNDIEACLINRPGGPTGATSMATTTQTREGGESEDGRYTKSRQIGAGVKSPPNLGKGRVYGASRSENWTAFADADFLPSTLKDREKMREGTNRKKKDMDGLESSFSNQTEDWMEPLKSPIRRLNGQKTFIPAEPKKESSTSTSISTSTSTSASDSASIPSATSAAASTKDHKDTDNTTKNISDLSLLTKQTGMGKDKDGQTERKMPTKENESVPASASPMTSLRSPRFNLRRTMGLTSPAPTISEQKMTDKTDAMDEKKKEKDAKENEKEKEKEKEREREREEAKKCPFASDSPMTKVRASSPHVLPMTLEEHEPHLRQEMPKKGTQSDFTSKPVSKSESKSTTSTKDYLIPPKPTLKSRRDSDSSAESDFSELDYETPFITETEIESSEGENTSGSLRASQQAFYKTRQQERRLQKQQRKEEKHKLAEEQKEKKEQIRRIEESSLVDDYLQDRIPIGPLSPKKPSKDEKTDVHERGGRIAEKGSLRGRGQLEKLTIVAGKLLVEPVIADVVSTLMGSPILIPHVERAEQEAKAEAGKESTALAEAKALQALKDALLVDEEERKKQSALVQVDFFDLKTYLTPEKLEAARKAGKREKEDKGGRNGKNRKERQDHNNHNDNIDNNNVHNEQDDSKKTRQKQDWDTSEFTSGTTGFSTGSSSYRVADVSNEKDVRMGMRLDMGPGMGLYGDSRDESLGNYTTAGSSSLGQHHPRDTSSPSSIPSRSSKSSKSSKSSSKSSSAMEKMSSKSGMGKEFPTRSGAGDDWAEISFEHALYDSIGEAETEGERESRDSQSYASKARSSKPSSRSHSPPMGSLSRPGDRATVESTTSSLTGSRGEHWSKEDNGKSEKSRSGKKGKHEKNGKESTSGSAISSVDSFGLSSLDLALDEVDHANEGNFTAPQKKREKRIKEGKDRKERNERKEKKEQNSSGSPTTRSSDSLSPTLSGFGSSFDDLREWSDSELEEVRALAEGKDTIHQKEWLSALQASPRVTSGLLEKDKVSQDHDLSLEQIAESRIQRARSQSLAAQDLLETTKASKLRTERDSEKTKTSPKSISPVSPNRRR